MAKQTEGGYQPPKRRRRGGFIVLGIVGSVVLLTVSSVFGALMYNWTHHPSYVHKNDVLDFREYKIRVNLDESHYKYDSASKDIVQVSSEPKIFYQNDSADMALFLERFEALNDEFPTVMGVKYDQYLETVEALNILKGSKVTFGNPKFLSQNTPYSIDKGEKNLATGLFWSTRGGSEELSLIEGDISDKKLLSNGNFYIHYMNDESVKDIIEIYYHAKGIEFTYYEYEKYPAPSTETYRSVIATYNISFNGYYSVVGANTK